MTLLSADNGGERDLLVSDIETESTKWRQQVLHADRLCGVQMRGIQQTRGRSLEIAEPTSGHLSKALALRINPSLHHSTTVQVSFQGDCIY